MQKNSVWSYCLGASRNLGVVGKVPAWSLSDAVGYLRCCTVWYGLWSSAAARRARPRSVRRCFGPPPSPGLRSRWTGRCGGWRCADWGYTRVGTVVGPSDSRPWPPAVSGVCRALRCGRGGRPSTVSVHCTSQCRNTGTATQYCMQSLNSQHSGLS